VGLGHRLPAGNSFRISRKAGAFRMADKALEDEFWKYYRSGSLHAFRPAPE
jgi:hypothetical protein